MSHLVKVSLTVQNETALKKALQRMKLSFQEGEFTLGRNGSNNKVQIKFDDSLGLQKQQDQSWMLVGDPYYCHDRKLRSYYGKQSQFDIDLKTAYAVEEATEQLEGMNFQCIENEDGTVGPNGKIRMVFQSLV